MRASSRSLASADALSIARISGDPSPSSLSVTSSSSVIRIGVGAPTEPLKALLLAGRTIDGHYDEITDLDTRETKVLFKARVPGDDEAVFLKRFQIDNDPRPALREVRLLHKFRHVPGVRAWRAEETRWAAASSRSDRLRRRRGRCSM